MHIRNDVQELERSMKSLGSISDAFTASFRSNRNSFEEKRDESF